MNQSLIIAHLNHLSQGQETIIELRLKGFITPEWMRSKGMFCCYSCGYVNPIDNTHCSSCRDEKFIITRDTAVFVYVKRKPYTRKMIEFIETIPNTMIIENYKQNDKKLVRIVKNLKYKAI